ncbi:hypothetical protein Tco_1558611, partial [Tanacetum coccineum]
RQGKDFSGTVTPLFPSMLASQAVKGEADEIVHEERGDSMERAATTAISLDAEQGSGNIIRTQSMATLNEPIPQGTSSGSGPRRQDTILGDKPAQTRIVSSTKKSLGDQEDASKQERNEINQDEGISWFQEDAETQGRYGHDTEINTASTSISTASINITIVEHVITASAPIATAGVSVSTAEPIPPQQQLDPKDKGKGIMQEPEKLVKVKGKDQIEYDADMAKSVITRFTLRTPDPEVW